MGFIDEQGRLHLSGRAKDLIIRGGHNIDPKVIEDALGSHPAVDLCAAVGAPDAYAGELPVAFVTLKTGAHVSEDELLAFTVSRVDEAPAKPKSVTVLAHMPVTNVGKIYKPTLRTLATATVVQGLVHQTLTALQIPTAQWPDVQATGDAPVEVDARSNPRSRLVGLETATCSLARENQLLRDCVVGPRCPRPAPHGTNHSTTPSGVRRARQWPSLRSANQSMAVTLKFKIAKWWLRSRVVMTRCLGFSGALLMPRWQRA